MQNKKINGIKLHNLRNALYLGFLELIVQVLQENNEIAPKLKRELDALAAGILALKPLYKKERGSKLTKEVAKADFRRDEAVKGINLQISSYLHHYEEEKRQAAKLLKIVMKNWGKRVAEKNYFAESTIIQAIVYNFTNRQNYIDAIAILHLTDWVTELQSANIEFNEKFGLRIEDVSKKPTERMKTKRLEVNKQYYKLRQALMAHACINDYAEPYEKMIGTWNVLIHEIKQSVRKRRKNKEENEGE